MPRAGLVVSLAVVFFVGSAFGQSAPDVEQGIRLYGSYHVGDIDNVSLTNGNLFVHADLFTYSQPARRRARLSHYAEIQQQKF